MGNLLLVANDNSLIGLWYDKQMYKDKMVPKEMIETDNHPILNTAIEWLDDYFAGQKSDNSNLPLDPEGGAFRKLVWSIISDIPYGEVQTYGEIAKEVAKRLGKESMSAQAVGGAVGHNHLCIIIPCHRVVGSNGSLTGYSGGIDKKIALLEHEGVELSKYTVPQTGKTM